MGFIVHIQNKNSPLMRFIVIIKGSFTFAISSNIILQYFLFCNMYVNKKLKMRVQ